LRCSSYNFSSLSTFLLQKFARKIGENKGGGFNIFVINITILSASTFNHYGINQSSSRLDSRYITMLLFHYLNQVCFDISYRSASSIFVTLFMQFFNILIFVFSFFSLSTSLFIQSKCFPRSLVSY